jgi:hypothetical protein
MFGSRSLSEEKNAMRRGSRGACYEAGRPSLHDIIRTEGAPSMGFFARVGGDAAGAILSVLHYPLCMPSLYASFVKYAKDGAPAAVGLLQTEGRPPAGTV